MQGLGTRLACSKSMCVCLGSYHGPFSEEEGGWYTSVHVPDFQLKTAAS